VPINSWSERCLRCAPFWMSRAEIGWLKIIGD
jgi:hypothetical protein